MSQSIFDSLKSAYLGGPYIQEKIIAIAQCSMDYRCSNGRCSFEVKHRSDSAKVMDMHDARAGDGQ